MIRELFLPVQIKGYYLFGQRIIGLDVGKTHVSATQVYLKGKKISIEKYVEEKLETGTQANYNERAILALQKVLSQLDKYDAVHSALSSAVAIFKEIKLPFVSYDKIKMVVKYEIEPLLPFSLSDAVVDFIITKQNKDESSSQVLVAAVQNQHIENHLQILHSAGIFPDIITIDLFALYGLYKKIPSFRTFSGNVALVDLGTQTTRMAYIQDGQLRFVRTINKGTYNAAKEVADALGLQPPQAMDYISRFGLEKSTNQQYMQSITQTMTQFWQEVQFTLQSFTMQGSTQEATTKIVLLGGGSEIKGLASFVQSMLNTPCELLHITDILHDPSITFQNKTILPSSSIISLSTAIPAQVTEQFNLLQGQALKEKENDFNKQIIVGAFLSLALLGSLFTYTLLQIRKFSNEAIASRNEALKVLTDRPNFKDELKEGLKSIKKEKDLLPEATRIAEDVVKQKEAVWMAFTGPARSTILKYLLELTKRIDKEALGFDIQSLSISEGTMTIKASVKSHDALKILERELKESKLFTSVSSPEETTFSMKITLAKSGEEQS
jgi:type IV pilus assembly protein PilM